jgi:nucleoside phosphorylase
MASDLAYCDFLVLAPLHIEISALTKALRKAGWSLSRIDTVDFPSVWDATLRDASVYHFTRRVIIIQLNHQGVLNASVDTAKALGLYEPGYVVSYGIAGSLTKEDAPIGSVVFATTLTYYEPSKDKGGRTESRMAPIPVGDSLLNPFRQIGLKHIKATDGPIASGEKLFADLASHDRRRIVSANSKTLVVEMEAAGVARCTQQLCPSSEVLVLKGVSDLSDKKKNRISPSVQRKNRAGAAANSSACLAQLMTKGPLRRAFRSLPRPADAAMPKKADEEADQILSVLSRYGINVGFSEMYACLYGRRGPIPAYYHWCQHGPGLHWIDFKILTALRALPRNVINPTPLVTLGDNVHTDQPWFRTVRRMLGVEPVTELEIRSQQTRADEHDSPSRRVKPPGE